MGSAAPSRIRNFLLCAALAGTAARSAAGGFDGRFSRAGRDTTPRFFHRAGLLPSGLVLVSGGLRVQLLPPSLISLKDMSFFDPATGSCSALFHPAGGGAVRPALAVARSRHTQTTLPDGRVLLTGGRTGAHGASSGRPTASVELFDTRTGAVTAGPAMSEPRAGHTATRLAGGRVVVAGGRSWQVFAPGPAGRDGSGRWSPPHPLRRSRTDHAAVALAGGGGPGTEGVLIIGGSGSGPATLERLDPDRGESRLLGARLRVGVDDLAAAVLDDGTVLIVGGQDLATGDTVDLACRFDPVTETIGEVPEPPGVSAGIADHQIVLLGRYAVVFGGEQQVRGVDCEQDYAAAFDRAAGDWVYAATMNEAHDDFAAVALADGRVVLVDGGRSFLGQEVPSFVIEIFTPAHLHPPDLDGDGRVNRADLLLLLAAWGSRPGCPEDLNGDGAVGGRDVQRLLAAWDGPNERAGTSQ